MKKLSQELWKPGTEFTILLLSLAIISDPRMTWQKLDDHCHRDQSATLEVGCMNKLTNAIDEPENQHESTYALLMRSEEKSRNLLEMIIYPLLIIGAIIAICQFVLQTVELPSTDTKAGLRITSVIGFHSCPGDRQSGNSNAN